MSSDDLAWLAGFDSLFAVVDVRGEVLRSNRPVPEGTLLDRVAPSYRDSVRALLLSGGFSTQPTRVQVEDNQNRAGWLELAPAGDGNVAVVWLISEVIQPAATPAPAQRTHLPTPSKPPVRPPRERTPAENVEFAIVADPEHREIAGNLRRALDTVARSVGLWIVPDVKGNLGAADSKSKVVILGDSRYTRFLRKLAGPAVWEQHGVCWAKEGRRAAVWVPHLGSDPRRDLYEPEAALEALLIEVDARSTDGALLAQTFLGGFDLGPVARRTSKWPMQLRYMLGVGRFLVDAYDAFTGSEKSLWQD